MDDSDNKLNRSMGLWSALSLVVGTIIGAGVFIQQSAVLSKAGTANAALLAWLAGGILTLAAGLTLSEIASQMPKTGGLYIYMEKMYGSVWGFLSGWMQVIVYGPAMIAALGAYLGILFVSFFKIPTDYGIPIGIGTVIVIATLNFFENKYGAGFAIVTTLCKMVPIIALIYLGLVHGSNNALVETGNQVINKNGSFGVAILATLFAFDGWILVANLGGEIKNAKKRLPQAIIGGILGVMLIYLLIAWTTFRSLSPIEVSRLGADVIPQIAIRGLGNFGGKILSIGIIISIIGCMNGKIMAFPRIMYAMAERREIPFAKFLSYLHPKAKTPIPAIVVTALIACLMLAFTNPDRLSELCIFTVYCFYILTFIGLFKLRRENKGKKLESFSVPLFPIVPLIAILGSLFVVVSEVMNDPTGVFISLLIVAIGVPIFLVSKRYYQNHHA